jgi:pre-mRNA-processing factor 40
VPLNPSSLQDEKRLAAKQAKDDLEKWLQVHEKMTPRVRYKKAEEWFGSEAVWKAVSDSDRKEIFRDVQTFLEKQEKVPT